MFSSDKWFGAEAGFYNSQATQSLRFDDGSSAYLTKTPSSASNRDLWTLSLWVKRSSVGTSGTQSLYGVYADGNNQETLAFDSGGNVDKLYWQLYQGGSAVGQLTTNRLFRDVSSWYHIVIAYDSANSTAGNRMRMYINGVEETSFATDTNPSSGLDSQWNSTTAHTIGRINTTNYFDGYIAEVNNVDGQALDPTYFGETKNGVWIPKRYTGSYGTNGFRLQFNQTGTGTASSSTIGADTSGNNNHFTSSGIVASDCAMPDSPENSFCTWNPLSEQNAGYLSEGNLAWVTSTASTNPAVIGGTIGVSSGKWYWEIRPISMSSNRMMVGIGDADKNNLGIASSTGSYHYDASGAKDQGDGTNWYGSSTVVSYGASYTAGDIIGIALDLDSGTVTFYKNNSSQGVAYTGLSGNKTPAMWHYTEDVTSQARLNTGQDSSFAGAVTAQGNTDANGIGDFYYAPPSGFLALCTSNLPEPTISPNSLTQADDHFNTVLISGNSGTQAITGVGFQPDWSWNKTRNATDHHILIDSSRGDKALRSNETIAEYDTGVSWQFDADGFTMTGTTGELNYSGRTYVSWNWKANGGTTSSNTDGSITSTVQANTTAGFSIVTYTGTGSNATVGHGLGATPDMVIYKIRDTGTSWAIWHKDLATPTTGLLELNSTGVELNSASYWNSTIPTSTVLSIGTYGGVNASSPFIAYCFAEVEGYSKFGSYTGNGSTDGAFVYTGFRPAFIIFKDTGYASDWCMFDNRRSGRNSQTDILYPNLSNTEDTSNAVFADILSNGFKWRFTNADFNASNNNYIYMAFAEAPFKYANAR